MRLGRFKTKDSALSYYVNQLENLDKRLYMPLTSVSWGRDINLRSGITLGDDATSFIKSTYAGAGTLQNGVGNMPWISAETTAIPGVSINGAKVVLPLRLLAREVSYTSVELERSLKLGNSIDTQKVDALNILYQMNTDQMVYIGSADVGATGLVNDASVTVTTAASVGTGSSSLWVNKTPQQILNDINAGLNAAWLASAYAVMPTKIMLPPAQFALLASTIVTAAGSQSVLSFLSMNSIANAVNGKPLEIVPVKWLTGAGVGGLDRMVIYTNTEDKVRFPMVPIRRETAYYHGIRFTAPYLWAFGQVEIPYPETITYVDGI